MLTRISDPNLVEPDPQMAMAIDLLKACYTLKDLDFMFPELSFVGESTWQVQVDLTRAVLFEWIDEFGAYNIRLE